MDRGDQFAQSTIASAKNGWLRILPYNIYTVVLTFPVIESPLKSCKQILKCTHRQIETSLSMFKPT